MPRRTPSWEPSRDRLTTHWPELEAGDKWKDRHQIHGAKLHAAWGEFLGRLPWDWMVTLTFDPKRVFPVGQACADREAWRWCTSLEWMFRRPVGWLYATERARSGLWHCHALVVGVEGMSWAVPVGPWELRNGKARVERVSEGRGAVLYTTKAVARGGEVTVSDTLKRYRDRLRSHVLVELVPDERGQCGAR